jgi:hypothetical protein
MLWCRLALFIENGTRATFGRLRFTTFTRQIDPRHPPTHGGGEKGTNRWPTNLADR